MRQNCYSRSLGRQIALPMASAPVALTGPGCSLDLKCFQTEMELAEPVMFHPFRTVLHLLSDFDFQTCLEQQWP